MESTELMTAQFRFTKALQNEIDRLTNLLEEANRTHANTLRIEANLSQRHGLLDAQSLVLAEMERSGSSESLRNVYNQITDRLEALRAESRSLNLEPIPTKENTAQ